MNLLVHLCFYRHMHVLEAIGSCSSLEIKVPRILCRITACRLRCHCRFCLCLRCRPRICLRLRPFFTAAIAATTVTATAVAATAAAEPAMPASVGLIVAAQLSSRKKTSLPGWAKSRAVA